jgi:hypothetical protein
VDSLQEVVLHVRHGEGLICHGEGLSVIYDTQRRGEKCIQNSGRKTSKEEAA